MATNDVSPARDAALKALTRDDLLEAAIALSSHIEAVKQLIRTGDDIEHWQERLDAAQCAHSRITAARIAE